MGDLLGSFFEDLKLLYFPRRGSNGGRCGCSFEFDSIDHPDYYTGIPVREGETYVFSMYARRNSSFDVHERFAIGPMASVISRTSIFWSIMNPHLPRG